MSKLLILYRVVFQLLFVDFFKIYSKIKENNISHWVNLLIRLAGLFHICWSFFEIRTRINNEWMLLLAFQSFPLDLFPSICASVCFHFKLRLTSKSQTFSNIFTAEKKEYRGDDSVIIIDK